MDSIQQKIKFKLKIEYKNIINKEDGKKEYDGTITYTVDVSNYNLYNEVYILFWGDDRYVLINNVTFEFKENFTFFDYNSYKNSVIKDIS